MDNLVLEIEELDYEVEALDESACVCGGGGCGCFDGAGD